MRYSLGGYVPVSGTTPRVVGSGARSLLTYGKLDDLLNKVPEPYRDKVPSSRCPGCGSYDYVLSMARGSYICAFCRTPCNTNDPRPQNKVRTLELSPDTIRQMERAILATVTNVPVTSVNSV